MASHAGLWHTTVARRPRAEGAARSRHLGAQAEALTARLQDLTNQLVAAVEGCPDDKWHTAKTNEGWSVGVTAHHAADGIVPTTGIFVAGATGQPMSPITLEMLNELNAKHAQEFANCSKAETIDLARKSAAQAAGMISGVSDEQFQTQAALPFTPDQKLPSSQLAEFLVIGHLQQHLASIQSAQ